MARRRESLGNVEASRSERYTGAGIVDSEVESERDTVPIFDNGGHSQHTNTQAVTPSKNFTPRTHHTRFIQMLADV